MVRRQGTRFGVTTNQSIRRSNIAASNQEVNQFVVVKTMSNIPPSSKGKKRILTEYSQQIQDGNLAIISSDGETQQNPILYSLNKHKRWELPEMLKENILDENNHTESKFQVTLSERHMGARAETSSTHSADCIAVHQSKSEHARRVPKGIYSFETDLTRPDRQNSKKRRKRKNRPGQVETVHNETVFNEENVLPEIHYEVCYPRPRNKYHNYGKAIKSHSDTVKVKSGKKSKKKSQVVRIDEDELGYFEEYVYHQEFTPVSSYKEDLYHTNVEESHILVSQSPVMDQSDGNSTYSPINLGDVLVTLLIDAVCDATKQVKPEAKRKRHRSKLDSVSSCDDADNSTKDHIVFIDQEDAERFQPPTKKETPNPQTYRRPPKNGRNRRHKRRKEPEPEPEPEPEKIVPVKISQLTIVQKISVNSLKYGNLYDTFGDCFYEGHCRPGRFAINLKPTVEEFLQDKGHDRIAKALMESGHQMLLLFEPFGCVEGVIGSSQPACRQVRVKVFGFPEDFLHKMNSLALAPTDDGCVCGANDTYYPWKAICIDPPAVHHSSKFCFVQIWSVKQIVQFCQEKISEIAPESFYRADGAISFTPKQPPVTLDTVQSFSQIKWYSCTPSAVVKMHLQSDTDVQPSKSTTDTKPPNCTICYESLLTSICGMDATALTECNHWFCNECWTQHLRSRVAQGDVNISCPEFNCDTIVDRVLLLAYLTPKEFQRQSMHCRNTTLSCQPDWQWCPNTACGRMVKTISKAGVTTNGDDTVAINCECGLVWCSSCKGEGHWPATCQQAAAYWKLIKKNGSVRWKMFSPLGDIKDVHVKKCPFCRNFIEKSDGCDNMFCVCKRTFCWNCLVDTYYDHDYSLCQKNAKKLTKVSFKEAKPVVTAMPGVALQHRKRRTRFAVMRRRKAAELLAKKAVLARRGIVKQSTSCLPNTYDTQSIASSTSSSAAASCKSLPLTWMQDDASSWQLLQEHLETAANAAKFCSEAAFCLEHLEVLLHDQNIELKSPATLLQLKDRLIFITDQLHMLLHGELKVKADSAIGRVAILENAGKKCLKWIAANVPLVLSQDDQE